MVTAGEIESNVVDQLAALPDGAAIEAIDKFCDAVASTTTTIRSKNGFFNGMFSSRFPMLSLIALVAGCAHLQRWRFILVDIEWHAFLESLSVRCSRFIVG